MERDDRARRWAAVSAERDRLVRLARGRLPQRSDAEDCAHEAMLRAMEFDTLDEARLPQFLTTVTLRLCADHHRANARRARAGQAVALRETADPGPEEVVCDRSEAAWLAGYVDTLPAGQRAALCAKADGLSQVEAARRLAVTDSTIESALARARQTLRRTLASSFGLVPWARRALVAGGVATVSAAALLHAPHHAPAPAPAARPPATAHAVLVTAGRPAATRPAAAHRPRAALRATRPVPVPVAPTGPRGRVPVDGYHADPLPPRPTDRLRDCVEEGVYVGSTEIGCAYPDDEPGEHGDGVLVTVPPPAAS